MRRIVTSITEQSENGISRQSEREKAASKRDRAGVLRKEMNAESDRQKETEKHLRG
jgi:hypothetical protein